MFAMPTRMSLVIGLVVFAAILGVAFLVNQILKPGSPKLLSSGNFAPMFRISKDTTVITGPLDSEGYPDYEAAVNQKYGAGIDPRQNMVVGLMGALGPKYDFYSSPPEPFPTRLFQMLKMDPPPDIGDYFISLGAFLNQDASLTQEDRQAFDEINEDLYASRPWKPADYPIVSRWLKANEKPLDQVIRASRLAQFYFPLADPLKEPDPTLYQRQLPFNLYFLQKAQNSLICRVWLKTGEGDFQGAKEDLLACRRIVQKIQPMTLIDFLARTGMESHLVQTEIKFIHFCGWNKEQLIQWSREIQAAKKEMSFADLCDGCLRFEILQDACKFHRFGNIILSDMGLFAPGSNEEKSTMDLIETRFLDWNLCLVEINREKDRLFAAFKMGSSLDRERESKNLAQNWKDSYELMVKEAQSRKGWFKNAIRDEKFMAKFLANLLLHAETQTTIKCQQIHDKREEENRLFQITLELAIFHREKGHYPDSLEELNPACVKAIPVDIFTDRPHRYQKTEDGYLL